ncbi:MAG: carbon storage regulator [Rhodobacteraceae bacterium]|nr:carbon storage regulator [Paracoccaceae bacterium]
MLVLQRREGQSVVIPGCRVEVVVKEVTAGMVKLGFLAPDHVDIYRNEIWREMCFADWNKDNRRDRDGNKD